MKNPTKNLFSLIFCCQTWKLVHHFLSFLKKLLNNEVFDFLLEISTEKFGYPLKLTVPVDQKLEQLCFEPTESIFCRIVWNVVITFLFVGQITAFNLWCNPFMSTSAFSQKNVFRENKRQPHGLMSICSAWYTFFNRVSFIVYKILTIDLAFCLKVCLLFLKLIPPFLSQKIITIQWISPFYSIFPKHATSVRATSLRTPTQAAQHRYTINL